MGISTSRVDTNVSNHTDPQIVQQDQNNWNRPTQRADLSQLNHIEFIAERERERQTERETDRERDRQEGKIEEGNKRERGRDGSLQKQIDRLTSWRDSSHI
jgi:hypothetical protein